MSSCSVCSDCGKNRCACILEKAAHVAAILPYRLPLGNTSTLDLPATQIYLSDYANCTKDEIWKLYIEHAAGPLTLGFTVVDPYTDSEDNLIALPITLLLRPGDRLYIYNPGPAVTVLTRFERY